jgi:hypothetical protein
MFDLSVSLLKILEFIGKEGPFLFLEQEMNLTRLSELLVFVLNRTTTGPDAKHFETLLKLDISTMDKISRFSIVSPLVGIILNLCKLNQNILIRSIIITGGFDIQKFIFLSKFQWKEGKNYYFIIII